MIFLIYLQVLLGQEVEIIQQEITNMIHLTEKLINLQVYPFFCRVDAFSEGVALEFSRLETDQADLREELRYLALELYTNETDVTICLDIALENVTASLTQRGK